MFLRAPYIISRIFLFFSLLVAPLMFNSCKSDSDIYNEEISGNEISLPTQSIALQNFYTDEQGTAMGKMLLCIDEYNANHNTLSDPGVITFSANIDDCAIEVMQTITRDFGSITQQMKTNCGIKAYHADDYILMPDYLSRHYYRELTVGPQEAVASVARRFSNGAWGAWGEYDEACTQSANYNKNIAFFGGSFSHNTRDNEVGNNKLGFIHGGKATSLQDLIAEKFACPHTGNYAQIGQGAYTGKLNAHDEAPFFLYNIYEQIKYALYTSKEKGFEYDVFLLFGGINDCSIGIPVGDVNEPAGDNTYIASLKKSIGLIKSNNPDAKVYIITSFPVFNNTFRYTLGNYVGAMADVAKFYNLPILNIYNLGLFDNNNYKLYYLPDNVHPNGEGYKAVASDIIEFLSK